MSDTSLHPKRAAFPVWLAVLAVILLFSYLRVRFYGDPALSIAGNDTITYVEASQVPLFSAEMLTGRRLLTTNLVYKLFEPEGGYEILVNGSLETTRRAFQPGFDKIVILQLAFSILGWGLLAWFAAQSLRNPWMKIFSTVFILAFAYSPHIADWDSILMSESLTFSLFALQFGLLIKMTFEAHNGRIIANWALAWGVVTFFWVFLRDTNLFTAVMTAGLIAPLMLSPRYRVEKTLKGVLIFLTLTVALGFITASMSVRSVVQVRNIYKDDVFEDPALVAIYQDMGMPVDSFQAPGFEAWLQEEGTATVARFMLSHPGYVAQKLARDFAPSFNEIEQTYFSARDLGKPREILLGIGDALHPENTTPFAMGLLMLTAIIILAIKNVPDGRPWAWLGLWLFLSASLTLIPTILGDTWALNRHALYSTTIFRLILWVYPIILADIALQREPAKA